MAITPANYFPLGSTIQKTFTDLQTLPSDLKRYEHFGIISVNPINGHMIIVYRKSIYHQVTGDSNLFIRYCNDGGANWSSEMIITTGSEGFNIDLRAAAGGYDGNGRLFIFYAIYSTVLLYVSMNYIYSDNDGNSWSTTQTLPTSLSGFLPIGHIVDAGNGNLYQTWYENNGSTIFNINIYKSTDGGASFSNINVCSSGIPYGESSLVNLGGGCFLLLSRIEPKVLNPPGPGKANIFRQFLSTDNCNNWSDQGDTSFEIQVDNWGAPPFLSYINYEGVGIVACYYTTRYSTPYPLLKVVFGLAKNLIENGTSGWISATKKTLDSFLSTRNNTGYQSFFHPLNQYNGIGVCFDANGTAFPRVEFSNITGMKNVLTDLGL